MTQVQQEEPALAGGFDWPRTVPSFVAWDRAWDAVDPVAADLDSLQTIEPSKIGEWVDRLYRANVSADRRGSPDLHGQLGQALRRSIDTVLCSVLDVDPAGCLSSAVAATFPAELLAGTLLLGRLTGASRLAVVADSRIRSSWLAVLRRLCRKHQIRFESIINGYPQGDPTLLLYAMLGRRLRPRRLPTEQGAIVIDAAAAVALGRFALRDEPMTQLPVVVRDHVQHRTHFVIAPFETTMAALLDRLGMPVRGRVLRGGDLLRDIRFPPEAVIGNGELILHVSEPQVAVNPSPCTRCGWCVDACPTRVQPATVLEAAQRSDLLLAERGGIEACIECGICSYVCPSHLPLLEGIRRMRELARRAPAT